MMGERGAARVPFEFVPYRDESKRMAAWEAHYRAKGCSPRKAREVAWRKRSGATWPPHNTNKT